MRERGQITLPAPLRRELGVEEGDTLALELVDGKLLVTPSRTRAKETLEAIRAAFEASGITEEELIAEGKRIRAELVREKYGLDAEA